MHLKVLQIEDSEPDAALLRRHLNRAGYDLFVDRVDTAVALRAALEVGDWEVILCDYSMPQLNALQALEIVKAASLDIPFIVISGTIGEETAVEAMVAGAHDYLMKDSLARLVPAIERELQEARNRRARKQAEAELRQSEARYRQLIDTTYEGVWISDNAARTIYVNQRMADMLGVEPGEMIGQPSAKFVAELGEKEFQPRWQRRNQGVKEQYDICLRHLDGSDVWAIVCATPVHREDGEFAGSLCMLTDITERKRAEQALIKSEERYRDLIENAHDVIYTHDLQGNYTSVNRSAERITGYTQEESLRMRMSEVVAPEFLEFAREMTARKIAGDDATAYEVEMIAKDGHRVPMEVNTRLIFENGIPAGVQGIARDISERRLLEAQLRQSQKMEAVGQLAGGVAHDFNNLLTAITGYSDLAMRKLQAMDPLRHNLEEINKAGQRAAALTRQLLAFSRKQVLQPKVVNLNSIVSDLEKMLQRLIGEDIQLRTELDAGLGNVTADPGQLEQVIMNLAINARDAMPSGGRLLLETQNVNIGADYAQRHVDVVPGNYVMLAVSDTGSGIDKETEKRIFEPFFTTKEVGKGTGLGLSTVYGIVKQSNGHIWVYSELNRGTSFKVYLPRVGAAAEEYKTTGLGGDGLRGSETILLIEDDDVLRPLAQEVLESFGYQVFEAANGGAALLICERHPGVIDLMITDVIMPEMSGVEAADRLSQLRPSMKVLFMSGYTDNSIVHHGVIDRGINFIQKPFGPDDLARKVREVLGQRL